MHDHSGVEPPPMLNMKYQIYSDTGSLIFY